MEEVLDKKVSIEIAVEDPETEDIVDTGFVEVWGRIGYTVYITINDTQQIKLNIVEADES